MATLTPTAVLRTARGTRSRGTAFLLAGVLLAAAASIVASMVLSGNTPTATDGLRDAGRVTGWVVPLTRGWLEISVFATMGCLVVGSWLSGAADGGAAGQATRILRIGGRWSLAWAVAALCLVVSTTAVLIGAGLREVLTTPSVYRLAWQIPQSRSLLVMGLVALAVALSAAHVSSATGARVLLAATGLSLAPLVASGHAGSASNHYVATQSLLVHVLAASLWVGGLSVIVVHLRGSRTALETVLPRFSRLALCCFGLVALSGVVGAWSRLGASWDAWASAYGGLLIAKTGALVVLGSLGALHRTWSLPRVAAGRRRAFVRFAVVEVMVMVVAVGLAVVLGRTAPPTGALARVGSAHPATLPTVDRTIDPLSPWSLLTEVRADALVVTVAVIALASYLLAARRLTREGEVWQRRRTASYSLGVVIALWAICGGLGSYAAALFSVQVAQLFTLALVVPTLLTHGAPVRLARTVLGERQTAEPGRLGRLVDPVNGLVVLVVVLAATFMTPLLDASLRSATLHTLLAGAALLAGFLFLWPLLAVDWVPARGRDNDDGALSVAVLGVLLLVFAGQTYASSSLFAGRWFTDLRLSWSDPVTDQRHGAVVVAVFAVALLVGAWRLTRSTRRVATGQRS